MNVLHNRMIPGDEALTMQFLDASLVTSASLTTLGLKRSSFVPGLSSTRGDKRLFFSQR